MQLNACCLCVACSLQHARIDTRDYVGIQYLKFLFSKLSCFQVHLFKTDARIY